MRAKSLPTSLPCSQLTVSLAIFAPADAGWTDGFIAVTDICFPSKNASFLILPDRYSWLSPDLSRGFMYEAGAFKSETGAISLQPIGGEQATIPHMKAKHVPYQLMYGP